MNHYRIPLYRPDLSGNEKKYVNECLDTSWISSRGRFVAEFEHHFAARIAAEHAIAVCNGTAALHLALLALGIGPGDEVIVPTLTYVASVNAIKYTGATPVFCDSLASSWQMDPDNVERLITPQTRAIMAVHIYGQPCDLAKLCMICASNRLFLIEDCAEAFGSQFGDRCVGTFGDIATFSFFGNKTLTTGEGGMVVTSNKALADRVNHFKGQGLAANGEYWHDVIGYNYRMTNIAAAIGLAQLERAAQFIARKRELAQDYQRMLTHYPLTMHEQQPGTLHTYWMVSALTERPEQRDALRTHLARAGIETRPLFHPVHTMPMYSTHHAHHAVAENLASRGFNLPSWPGLGDQQLQDICRAIGQFYD